MTDQTAGQDSIEEPSEGPEAIAHPGLLGRVRRLAIDVRPLRKYRDFRLLWGGLGLSFLGSMFSFVAVPFQVFQLSHSVLAVGALGVVELVPLLSMALFGGVLADTFDRRRMMLVTEGGQALATVALLVNALLPHPRLWVIYLLVALLAGLSGVGRPAREALVPRIVERADVPAAAALMALYGTFGLIVGPALGGVMLAWLGVPATYVIDALSFVASLLALRAMGPVPAPDPSGVNLRSLLEGFRFVRGNQLILGTYAIDINAMFFGMPTALFPALAVERFHDGAQVLGLLFAAPAAGSLLVTLSSGWTSRVHRHGRAIALSAALWGVAMVGFGLSPGLWLGLGCLAFAGGADMVSGLFRATVWNQAVPDHLRGRMAGIEMVSYTSGPLLGNFEAGAVGAWRGLGFSVVSGGALCVAGTVALCLLLPRLVGYDSRVAPA